jgi:putative transcriptional regulator
MSDERSIFEELLEGVDAMAAHRRGKLTLRTHSIKPAPPPRVDGAYIRATREELNMSAPVFATGLRISPRTLERWERGRAPAAAAVLIGLVRRYPDMLARIAKLETTSATGQRARNARLRVQGGQRRAGRDRSRSKPTRRTVHNADTEHGTR